MFVFLVFVLILAALAAAPIAGIASAGRAVRRDLAVESQPASRRSLDWEIFTGGRLFSIVGAIMVIVGGGLLMKYAIDHNWFPASVFGVTARVVVGFIAGGALAIAGDRQVRGNERGDRTWFGQALVGAGLGSLYVSGYAACASAQLISLDASFAIMSLVTAVAFVLAFRYDAFAIALIGWFGAFVTPFVVDDPNVSQVALASYLLTLDFGLCAIALIKRRWFALAPLALVASSLASAVWFVNHSADAAWYVSAIALATSWSIFFTTGLIRGWRERATAVGFGALAEIANTAILWIYLGEVLNEQRDVLHAMLAGVAAALALASALAAKHGCAPLVRATYGVLAVASAIVVTSFYITAPVDRSIAFALAAVALCAAARVAHRSGARHAGIVEAPAAATCSLFAAFACYASAPNAFTVHDGFSPTDLALAILIATLFACDRLTREVLANAPQLSVALRAAASMATLVLIFTHARGVEGATYLALETVGALAVDRALRRVGGLFGSVTETLAIVASLLSVAVATLFATPDTFAYRGATFAFGINGADLAILTTILAGALLAYAAKRAGSPAFALAARIVVTVLAIAASAAHARDHGLATLYAVEAIAAAALARISARSGAPRAFDVERFVRATTFGLAAIVAYIAAPQALAFRGWSFAWNVGGADLALASIAFAALVLSRVAVTSAYRHEVVIAFRQTAILVASVALGVHCGGERFAGAFALAALAMTACAAIARRNVDPASSLEFAIDAFLALAASDLALFAAPSTWLLESAVRFVPLFNERFIAFGCAALATIAFAAFLEKSAMLAKVVARAFRALGIVIAVLDLTLDIRDAFGVAIARAANDLASPDAIAHLQTLEAVAISLTWVIASIAILTLGIRRRARDLRVVALGLFDLTILKAFFFDIATPDALERIIAFIMLGLVLLGVSYVYQRFERSFDKDPAPHEPLEEGASLAA